MIESNDVIKVKDLIRSLGDEKGKVSIAASYTGMPKELASLLYH